MRNLPIARATDPQNSHDAAEKITKSGLRHSQQQTLVAAIYQRPGLTWGELGEATGIKNPWRRCSELVRMGFVHTGTRAKYHGYWQATYWPGANPSASKEPLETHECLDQSAVIVQHDGWKLRVSGREVGIRWCPFCGCNLAVWTGVRDATQPRLGI